MGNIDLRRNRNVELSAHIAGEILQFSTISQILRHVSERWDGLGYPDELKKEEIPDESTSRFILSSRILAIADFFVRSSSKDDAKNAILLLKEESKKRFDPNLVKKFEVFCTQRKK